MSKKPTQRIPEFIWGRKFPKIIIDQEKCPVPFACKKCIQICPEACFSVGRVMQLEKRLEEMDPRIDGNFRLGVSRRDKCITCNKCIDVCPVDAITIEVPEQETFGSLESDEKWGLS